ncbi:hypothetical protein V6C03_00345 [Methyloligella sp. 2.7D]|uniref:hypothetical protein n=1 Tax=unclassified Methyloligella TaxID=2625955 RepID=UPI00157D7864|nr:hypothetical protein [Methyloligella sp. GL2]QKP76877.1 hypothetical protein HT051_05065 [Methyloligella sp. GL2]
MKTKKLPFILGAAAIGFAMTLPAGTASAAPGANLGQPSHEEASNVTEVGFFRRRTYYVNENGEHVRAPLTDVDVKDGDGTKVRAPFADVDTQGGKVRVRAPFVDLILPKD